MKENISELNIATAFLITLAVVEFLGSTDFLLSLQSQDKKKLGGLSASKKVSLICYWLIFT